MTPAELARKNAIPLEIKKDGLQQRQNGDWVLRFVVQASDMDERITRAGMGTRYQAVLVAIGDDELPVQQPAKEKVSKPAPATPQSKDKPAGVKQEIIFTCKKCEANYSVPEAVKECPVCSWKPKRDWADVLPSAQASMLCDKPVFQAFLREQYPDEWHEAMADPDECVRLICAVDSKSKLNDGPHRVIWHQLQTKYQAWEAMERV